MCNGLLRVCAYVARRNALDNCYYLKLHLPPPFFYKFRDKYPNGGIALCGLECVPPTDDFFMQKYATDQGEKYDSGTDRAPTTDGIYTCRIESSDAAPCGIMRIQVALYYSKNFQPPFSRLR